MRYIGGACLPGGHVYILYPLIFCPPFFSSTPTAPSRAPFTEPSRGRRPTLCPCGAIWSASHPGSPCIRGNGHDDDADKRTGRSGCLYERAGYLIRPPPPHATKARVQPSRTRILPPRRPPCFSRNTMSLLPLRSPRLPPPAAHSRQRREGGQGEVYR
ncbi:hypothetical protein DPEC_G00154390 [Dallia pectoralis]|uniref:Uncharacterized protein n=1 Tax=Dallia pectoralis TaxID=75939 RepID=A0ACC2GKM7_DALPE|nr:hypothetical protein DPEC_G00154390 [Dallia pectoralis]